MPNGFDFEAVYGKPFDEMTHNEREMAMLSQQHYARMENQQIIRRLDKLNGTTTRNVSRLQTHQTYFKIIWAVTGSVLFPILVAVIILFFQRLD